MNRTDAVPDAARADEAGTVTRDVVVIGGAIAGASYFLLRVLKLYDHLSREQLPKQGFRYWFHNERVTRLREASEVGPTQLARTPSFQLDRAVLDSHVLGTAEKEGAEVWRPAKVVEYSLEGEQGGSVTVEKSDGTRVVVRAKWIVDATGRQALLARRRGGVTPIESHPTSAIWVRYRGVKDLDGTEVVGTDPADPFARGVVAARRLATNHFTGWGYWIWLIPLRGGETSVGLVWDKRLVQPEGATTLEKLTRFLDANPLTRELVEHAEPVDGDCRYYGHLPYFVDRFIGPGWTCVGDAGGFLDPFYSPGLQPVYNESASRLGMPPFFGDGAEVGLWPMRFYRGRLVAIAKRKKELGIYGNHNHGRRPRFVGFTLRAGAHVMLCHGLLRWAKAEAANALTYVVKPRPIEGPRPDLPPRPVAAGSRGAPPRPRSSHARGSPSRSSSGSASRASTSASRSCRGTFRSWGGSACSTSWRRPALR